MLQNYCRLDLSREKFIKTVNISHYKFEAFIKNLTYFHVFPLELRRILEKYDAKYAFLRQLRVSGAPLRL